MREVARPRWTFRLGPPSLDGLTRRRGDGLVRLLHVDGSPVLVALAVPTRPAPAHPVFAARAASEATAREGIARMRFAVGVDDDLTEFYARFAGDPVIGRAVRARPWLRVRRHPEPWEALMWAITEQLIDMPRALGIQRRMIARFGRRDGAFRDSPAAAAIAACAPAELEACGLAGKRAIAMRRAAREVAAGRVAFAVGAQHGAGSTMPPAGTSPDFARLLAISEIGTWTIEMLALHGLGRMDVVPAGDLNYLKLVGQLTTGNPKAIADEAEVRGFFAPYAPWAGLAASHLIRARTRPSPRPAGTRWSAVAPRSAAA